MTKTTLALGTAALLSLTLIAGAPARAAEEMPPARPAVPGFDRFQALAGDWVAAEDGQMAKKGDLVARYHLTGGGSAVVEELFPGTEHAMTTVYHTDGKDIVLTHYCMLGNQPHMRAKQATGPRVDFVFDGGTNINPKKDMHMHSASVEFLSANEIKSTWQSQDQGKPAMTVQIHLMRKEG